MGRQTGGNGRRRQNEEEARVERATLGPPPRLATSFEFEHLLPLVGHRRLPFLFLLAGLLGGACGLLENF
jgi:hypothetical protein